MSSPTAAELLELVREVGAMTPAEDDASRIDQIAALERLKAACAAAQARVTWEFATSQREAQEAAGTAPDQVGRGIGHQVGLARRESPWMGNRLVGLARALVEEMPHTLAALTTGDVNEWRATVMVRETAALSREDRTAVDAALADRLGELGARRLGHEARAEAARLDPYAVTKRAQKAHAERHVGLRPAPDTMTWLSALLPVADGVAAKAALEVAADRARAAGDDRNRGQVMADLLVDRVTGRAAATGTPTTWAEHVAATTWAACDTAPELRTTEPDAATESEPPTDARPSAERAADADAQPDAMSPCSCGGDGAPAERPGRTAIELKLVMSDQALFGFGPQAEEAAWLEGYGPIPAPLARRIAGGRLPGVTEDAVVWLRRLWADPVTGVLTQLESRARHFPPGLRRFLTTRDQVCRTPWCDAPVRHLDHAVPAAHDGPTDATNGNGRCRACNLAKEATGWITRPESDPTGASTGTLSITTPTGHGYTSAPPALLNRGAPARPPDDRPAALPLSPAAGTPPVSASERYLRDLLWAA